MDKNLSIKDAHEAKKEYDEFIAEVKLKDRKKDDIYYYENHHILPDSMGGTNATENMIYLTYSEHIKAHWLLVRLTFGIKDHWKMGASYKLMCDIYFRGFGYLPNKADIEKLAYVKKIFIKEHRKHITALQADPDSNYNTHECIENHSKASKAMWRKPGYKKRLSKSQADAWENIKRREKFIISMETYWADPEHRKERGERSKAMWENYEYREKQAESLKAMWKRPGYKKRLSKSQADAWENPDKRKNRVEGMNEYHSSPEGKATKTRTMVEKWNDDPEQKQLKAVLAWNKKRWEKDCKSLVIRNPDRLGGGWVWVRKMKKYEDWSSIHRATLNRYLNKGIGPKPNGGKKNLGLLVYSVERPEAQEAIRNYNLRVNDFVLN